MKKFILKKFILGLILSGVLGATPTFANNQKSHQTKINIVTQMVYSGDLIYDHEAITSDLFDLTMRMREMDEYVMTHYDAIMGCNVDVPDYLGHLAQDTVFIQNVKVNVVNNNLVRATFQMGTHPYHAQSAVLVEFVMQDNKVNDVRVAYSFNNPNKIPTTTTASLQNDFRKLIQTHCGFKTH